MPERRIGNEGPEAPSRVVGEVGAALGVRGEVRLECRHRGGLLVEQSEDKRLLQIQIPRGVDVAARDRTGAATLSSTTSTSGTGK